MKSALLFISAILFSLSGHAQYDYEPSSESPFGKPNPEAPEQIRDFGPLIGESECESLLRNQDGTWAEIVSMTWRFKYIMNGMAVQDETFKENGFYAGSIRQYITDSARWYVHYYSSKGPTPILPAWEGNKTEPDKMVLTKDSKAPNGMEGNYRITFYDMTESAFKWIGEWTSKDESIIYPTWKISCTKRKN